MREKYWNSNSKDELFKLCVGQTYGVNPVDNLSLIKENKGHEAYNLNKILNFNTTHKVVDLGSGCGFIAAKIAPLVDRLYCLDIDENFLNYCKEENQNLTNVHYALIKYGDLSILNDKQIDIIYATAVFIHFNLYDLVIYLEQCYKYLSVNGKLLFNFLNSKMLKIDNTTFQRHTKRYMDDPVNLFTNVYYNHPDTVKSVAKQIGFSIIEETYEQDRCFLLLSK